MIQDVPSTDQAIVLMLHDMLIDVSPDEVDVTMSQVTIELDIQYTEAATTAPDSVVFKQLITDLNYMMACNYLSLQRQFPCVFSYPARLRYTSSARSLPYLIEMFSKSKQTARIEKQRIVKGFFKQIVNGNSFEAYINGLTKSQLPKVQLSLLFFSIMHLYSDTAFV